jgi:telomerase reverse transcriptase
MGKKRKRPAKEDTELRSPLQKRAKAPPDGLEEKVGGPTRPPGDHPVLSRYYGRVVTLRQFILDRLQSSSKSKRRRIALLGKQPNMEASASTAQIVSDGPVGRKPQPNGKDIQGIADLLDFTLVGVVHDASKGTQDRRQREFVAFTHQSQNRSFLTNSDAASLQGEVNCRFLLYIPRYIVFYSFKCETTPYDD